MKYLIPVLAIATATALNAQAMTPSERGSNEFNQGDLVGIDELSTDEDDGLDFEQRESFYRAATPKQLEAHSKKRVQLVVNKSMKERGYQYIQVYVDGSLQYDAPVSTAWEREAKAKTRTYFSYTPVGKFMPDGMQTKRFSNTWQVWLKYVIRFSGGVWLHATTPDHYAELGAPASGGCVRIYEADAKEIYDLVSKFGGGGSSNPDALPTDTAITVLPADSTERQIPWAQSKLPMPRTLLDWRAKNGIK